MATMQERAELHKTIWKIANDLRGSVDGWEFKAYVLGSIFYRFISENICEYFNHRMHELGYADFDYANMKDEEAQGGKQDAVQTKGFFMLPSQLFQNVVQSADKDENLNEHLTAIFRSIEASAQGTESEDDLRGLFSDFSVDSQALGSTVIKRNQLLAKLVKNDDILENDCNLSVSSYVEQEDTREVIDIKEVNSKLESLIAEGNELNKKIDEIIKELN